MMYCYNTLQSNNALLFSCTSWYVQQESCCTILLTVTALKIVTALTLVLLWCAVYTSGSSLSAWAHKWSPHSMHIVHTALQAFSHHMMSSRNSISEKLWRLQSKMLKCLGSGVQLLNRKEMSNISEMAKVYSGTHLSRSFSVANLELPRCLTNHRTTFTQLRINTIISPCGCGLKPKVNQCTTFIVNST